MVVYDRVFGSDMAANLVSRLQQQVGREGRLLRRLGRAI